MSIRSVSATFVALSCLVGAAAAQSTWTGATSNSWDDPSNWTPPGVPDAGTDVIIAPSANDPSSFIANPSCNSLAIQSGATLSLTGGFDLTVGDVDVDGAFGVTLAGSSVTVLGDWTNDGSFSAGGSTVAFFGIGSIAGANATVFHHVAISTGTRSALTAFEADGNASIASGASLDIGTETIRVAGNWTSSGAGSAVLGTGTLEFDGNGTVATGTNTLPAMRVSAGTRTASNTVVSGDLTVTGGTLLIANGQTLTVGGNADLSGGSFGSTGAGTQTLLVSGNVSMSAAAAGSFAAGTRIECAGNWTQGAAFDPPAGSVRLHTGSAASIGGAPRFFDLEIADGVKAWTGAGVVENALLVSSGTLQASAALDVDGDVTVAAGAAVDTGGLTLLVGGDWTSSAAGATVSGGGGVSFDGDGNLDSGLNPLPGVAITAGTRTASTSIVSGDLTMSGGRLLIASGAQLSVIGDAPLSGGSLGSSGPGSLRVLGDVALGASADASFDPGFTIECRGNWSQTAAFDPIAGAVTLNGGTPGSISGTPVFFALEVRDSTKTLTSSGLVKSALTVTSGTFDVSAPLSVLGDVAVNGGTLDANAALDVDGSVTVASGATFDTNTASHRVGGSWTSSAASATTSGTGTIEFDGDGTTGTGLNTIPAALLSAGTRSWNNTQITGGLTMTGGRFQLNPVQRVTVAGDALLTGGTLGSTGAGVQSLNVLGNVSIDVAPDVDFASGTTVESGKNWTQGPAFAPTTGLVRLDGVDPGSVTGALSFFSLEVRDGPKTLGAAATVAGNLTVASGTLDVGAGLTVAGNVAITGGTLDASTSIDVDGDVTVSPGGTFDTNAAAHRVGGDWTSGAGGAAVAGTGTVEFDGDGTSTTGANALPNALLSAGARSWNNSVVAVDLTVTGGQCLINEAQRLTVNGNASFTGGTFGSVGAGTQTLQVNGDLSMSATPDASFPSGTTILCRGDWTQGAAFAPTTGTVRLDGAGAASASGALSFFVLDVRDGVKTAVDPAVVASQLVVPSGTLEVAAALDVQGALSLTGGALSASAEITVADDVLINNGSAFATGTGLVHRVTGDWTSSGTGSTATGTSTIAFDGPGTVSTGVGALPSVRLELGLRQFATSTISGNLEITGGELRVGDDATVLVQGDALLTAGTLSFAGALPGIDVLDVDGDVTATIAVSGTTAQTRIRCGGDWISSSTFAPTAGSVELDGTTTTQVSGVGPSFDPIFAQLTVRNGTRQLATDLNLNANSLVIDPGGVLVVGTHTLTMATGAIADRGRLAVGAGGELRLGPTVPLVVNASGTLSLLGTGTEPATVRAAGAPGYTVSVAGTIQALNFVFQEMSSSGILISSAATLGVPPNDLRGGLFTLPAAVPGSVLLHIERPAPTALSFLRFEDPLAVGTYGVRTFGGAAIAMTNASGALSGEAFDDDPFNLVSWVSGGTTVSSFTGTPGKEKATLKWTTTQEVDTASFVLERASAPGGPFALVSELTAVGPSTYQVLDQPLTADVASFYRLSGKLTYGPVHVLGNTSVTPWSGALPGFVLEVGPASLHTTIQSALDAAVGPLSVVKVTAGTYPAFTIGAGFPGTVHVVGDGSGPVLIDTSAGPVTIAGTGFLEPVELSDLTIGSSGTAGTAVLVTACLGPVILDDLDVSCAVGFPAIDVQSSISVALQRSTVSGDPGMRVGTGSVVMASRGSLDEFDLSGTSSAKLTQITPGTTVEAGSTLTQYAGVMPDIDMAEFHVLNEPFTIDIETQPGAVWRMATSLGIGWFDLGDPAFFQMNFLLNPFGAVLFAGGVADGAGQAALPLTLPADPGLFGIPFPIQALAVDLVTISVRFSNVATIFGMP